jgi:hypothetical protein
MQTRTLAALALAAALAALLPEAASAIPAFARRYRFSCTTCHTAFPQLRPYGAEFAGRGFALEPGQEPAGASIDAGDPLLALPRHFPLAVRFDAFAQASEESPELDFQAPWVVKLLTGGQIAPKIGFYAYFIIEEGEVIGFEDAYVHFDEVLGLPLDVLAGQFQLSDPIAKREVRLTRLDYQILKARVGLSPVDLTYDRGIALALSAAGFDAVGTATNGTGLSAGTSFDGDARKNLGLDLAREMGPVRLGLYGFWGEQEVAGVANETWMVGPHLDVEVGQALALRAAWIWRRDSNATFVEGEVEVATGGGFAEAIWYPGGWNGRWAVVGLYNQVESDDDAADLESAGLAATWLLRRNVRLTAEVDYDLGLERWTGSVGTVLAY